MVSTQLCSRGSTANFWNINHSQTHTSARRQRDVAMCGVTWVGSWNTADLTSCSSFGGVEDAHLGEAERNQGRSAVGTLLPIQGGSRSAKRQGRVLRGFIIWRPKIGTNTLPTSSHRIRNRRQGRR
uniref:(northern house mosquito) hypothetical protein n=1 Tax=Culex pipiens TaxID=7175 RepID=A0A8D8K6N7_CULPI